MRLLAESTSTDGIRLFDSPQHKHGLYASALQLLCDSHSQANQDKDTQPLIIKLGGKVIKLNNLVGFGSCKKVYDLGDGTVIMLPNLDADGIYPAMWERVVLEEVAMAKKVIGCGLRAQNYEEATITINDFPLIVIKTASFAEMIKQGWQVRDKKRSRDKTVVVVNSDAEYGYEIRCVDNEVLGSSDIFGCKENLRDVNYWRKIMASIAEDLAIYFANDLFFPSDSFNLLIEDTPETPIYSLDQRASIGRRYQQLRMYFYDFSSKGKSPYDDSHYKFLDETGAVIEGNIRLEVNAVLPKISSIILCGVSNAEFRNIMQREPSSFMILEMTSEAAEAMNVVIPEFTAKVISLTKEKIEAMSREDRFARFSLEQPNTRTNSASFEILDHRTRLLY